MTYASGERVPSLKHMAFNAVSTPNKETGLSCLQSACIEGDVHTVKSILHCSPDKLDSAIALSVKIGPNASHFEGKSILTALSQQNSPGFTELSGLIETFLSHFQSKSLLHLAAKKGRHEHLRRLLDCGECVNSASPDEECSETPLMLAARYNKVDVVQFLLENGASLEIQDEDGFTPFHHAVRGGNMRNVLRLIEFGANVLRHSYEETSAMHLAAQNGQVDIIKLLLEHGVGVNQVDMEGVTPVMLAARSGHLEAVRVLIENGGDLNPQGLNHLPLHYAALGEHTSVVKFLLEKGSNLFAREFESNETVLHMASGLELVSFLVEQGADIHARDRFGQTPLHFAGKKGQTDTINYLLDRGANVNARAVSGIVAGYPPLFSALLHGYPAAAKTLLERGTNFQYTEEEEDVSKFLNAHLLILAAEHGFADVLKLLLDKSLPVDAIKGDGETALMAAARAGQCETVTVLLDRGANINGTSATDLGNSEGKDDETNFHHRSSDDEDEDYYYPRFNREKGITPLHCAIGNGKGEVARLLIERGADTSNLEGVSTSLVELAAKNSLSDIVGLLAEKNRFDYNKDYQKFEDREALLTSAADRGDVDSVETLLRKGVDVNTKNMFGDTALASVLQSGARPHTVMEIVKLLLSFGADINVKNDQCKTPLLIAVRMNVEKVAEHLLELGCDVNVQNVHSHSPLHYAAQNNNGKLAEMLLQYGAETIVKTATEEMTPLHMAALTKSLHVVQVLLEHGDVDLEVTDSLGRTPLALAAASGCCPIVQSLILQGSNVNTKDKYGTTPLITAVQNLPWHEYEAFDLIKTLLENGSSVNATDQQGRSALHYLHMPRNVSEGWPPRPITHNGPREFCDLLLHYGACVTLQDKNGETPLHFAASSGDTVATEWFLEHGADVGALDMEKRTPLHAAAYGGYGSSVELLIQNGADVHLPDNRGWRPLHLAAVRDWQNPPFDAQAAEILLQNGSDVTAVDKKGRSVLHLAAKTRRVELCELLIRHGCDVNTRDVTGETVLEQFDKTPHHAYNLENILQLYFDNGGDMHAVDTHGRTVLHFAAAHAHGSTLLDSLLEQGLNIEARDKNGETALHRAAAFGNSKMIELLVARGADLSAVNHRGQTPLLVSLASYDNQYTGERDRVIEGLLKHKSDVQVSDKSGNTALHFAIFLHLKLLKRILQSGGNVNAVNAHGCTPLHQAAYKGSSVKHIRELVRARASIHCQDKEANTPLHTAIARGNDDITEVLINEGSDVSATNLQGRTCLHLASCFGPKRILEQVILHGGQINAVDELGSTPLHLAGLLTKHGLLAKLLLKHGSDPRAVDYKGSTPLHVACCSGNKEAASVLIDYGSNLEAKDNKGCTPLHICSVFDQKPTARLLLERGAHVDAKDNEGSTPLHLASAFSDVHMVCILLEHGANVTARDSEGGTALHTAAALGKIKTVQALIDAGSDVNVSDENGYTPLHVSAASGHMEIVRLLVDNGAEVNAVDKEGLTPARCAEKFGHGKVKQYLEEKTE